MASLHNIFLFGLVLILFYLDTYTNSLNPFIIILITIAFYFLCTFSKFNNFERSDGWLIDTFYTEICLLEYKYKNKTYKIIVEISDNGQARHKIIDIKVCRFFPRVIYVVKEPRNKKNKRQDSKFRRNIYGKNN